MELEKKALIVEDDEDIQDLLVASMETRGFACDVAPNLNTSLEYIALNSYNVIITNNHFPEKEGWPEEPNKGIEFIERIKKQNLQKQVILIMHSGSAYGLSYAESIGIKTIRKEFDNLDYCLDIYLRDPNAKCAKKPCFFERLFGE
ncbi:MAG: response regulator [Candidatus Nanoarchaeia archaeon]|nr:response regulator [Candidatus Nanoarchaeia archaeon]